MLVDKDGNVRGIAPCHSTRMGGHALDPTNIGSESLAKELQEFHQFWSFRATKEVVTTASCCRQPFTMDILQYWVPKDVKIPKIE